ncbi:MAG: response regulator [Desulfobacterales bacterium]|nr:response regulator [Desulfobacterales bacterium]MCP4163087.1 response regulator [Deltaproteobacteria bacterium]
MLNILRILIIDSDQKKSDELINTLSEWHVITKHASSAREAVALSKKLSFDVALMELSLPDKKGYEIIPDLKLYNPGIHIMTMTENNSPTLETKVRQCGVSFYFGKPVPLDQLREILNHLDRSKANIKNCQQIFNF